MSQSIADYPVTNQTTKNPKTRFKEVNFGQGYRQILVDGLNSSEESWSMDFVPMDSTAAENLESILLESVTSSTNFISWTPIGETETKYYTAHEVQKRPVSHNLWKITCTLRREYLLG